ncbi:hypothetical protein KY361_02335 [Candidatus Woesearchaeota archaeon]|nr:hypothetical protein [Candidatus Woesearchaeota archaeon]
MADILDTVSARDLKLFKKDFREIIRIAFGMDKIYGEVHRDFDFYKPKYDRLIKRFDKKYKNLNLKLKRTEEELKLRIFIREKSVVDVFNKVACKIAGLKSVGAKGFGVADVSETAKFSDELGRAKEKLYISYYEAESGSNTIYLEYDKKVKMVEVHYNLKAIRECKSPEFKLIAYYALKEFDKKIDLLTPASKFGFSSLLLHDEMKEWLEEFDEPFTE